MSANTSRGRILDGLMEQKRNGTLPGIFGRLGDLGAIDEKYDGAVSTACGPLDNIVVDTVDTAQKCIGYLKHCNLGRASFIALEKMVFSSDFVLFACTIYLVFLCTISVATLYRYRQTTV